MRIAGVHLPKDKRLFISLTYIYGIGRPTACKVCDSVGVPSTLRVSDLTEEQTSALVRYITEHLVIEGDLRRESAMQIKKLSDIGCYRGIRHRKKLPVRGQRTRSNARTRKGRARVPVAGKKKAV